jgi:hypothetical protein
MNLQITHRDAVQVDMNGKYAIFAMITLLSSWGLPALAGDWSDNAIGWRYGNKFREPFNNQDISKNIFSYTHASGSEYGSDFFNVDVLISDSKDPSGATSTTGAIETYVVYRHTFDIGKISSREIKFGLVRGFGITGGFDFNDKHDIDYNSRKRMLALGPTFMMDVQGFLNFSLLLLWESNNPSISPGAFDPGYPGQRYYYKTHADLNAAWAVPMSSLPISFEGFGDYIGAKGRDELGNQTAPEFDIDMKLMHDVAVSAGRAKFRLGLEYQYWHNKFGSSNSTVAPLGGNTASTPMIRADYHF